MIENKLRRVLSEGRIAIGSIVQDVTSPAFPLICSSYGLDFLFIDMEHTTYGMETIANIIMVTRLSGLTPIVRIPDLQYHFVSRCLDAGAQGIILPRVETREQVERLVEYSKFPPLGSRGCSITRGHNNFQPADVLTFVSQANKENMVIIQLESRKAIENIDSILSAEGIDCAFLGARDLGVSCGIAGNPDDELIGQALQALIDAGKKYDVHIGLFGREIPHIKKWVGKGVDWLIYNTDLGLIRDSLSRGIKELRAALPEAGAK